MDDCQNFALRNFGISSFQTYTILPLYYDQRLRIHLKWSFRSDESYPCWHGIPYALCWHGLPHVLIYVVYRMSLLTSTADVICHMSFAKVVCHMSSWIGWLRLTSDDPAVENLFWLSGSLSFGYFSSQLEIIKVRFFRSVTSS